MPGDTAAKPKQFPQYIASVIVSIGAFALGTVFGWANVVQKAIESGDMGFSCSKEEFSWISSGFVLGAMIVCIPAGYLINLIGRKWTIIVMCIPFIIGWVLLYVGLNLWMMFIGRFILGIAGATYCISVPVYTAEIALKDVRGLLGTLFQFMIVIGGLFMFIIGAVLNTRKVSLISCIFPITLAIFALFVPESPTYLVYKNKDDQALKSLSWLRGTNFDNTLELFDIKRADAAEKSSSVPMIVALKRPETIRSIIISVAIMILQQLSGITAVIFYSTGIFRDTNTEFSAALSTIMLGVVQLLATFVSLALIDKLGRRSLLLISAGGMTVCLLVMALYFYMKQNDLDLIKSLSWLPVSSMCTYMAFFSIGYGPIPWIIMGEIFSMDIKGLAGSIAATTNWTFAFIVTKTFVNLKDLLGIGGTFMFFTVITGSGILFVWHFVIETKGKSLNEIQIELAALNKRP